jgi:hypothetical protein
LTAIQATTHNTRATAVLSVRRAALAAALLVLGSASAVAIPAIRAPILGLVGAALVAQDPLGPADAIVIAPDLTEAGALDVADLVEGSSLSAARVMVIAPPVNPVAEVFAHRGVAYEDRATQVMRLLRGLGVEQAELLRLAAGGTEDAGRVLPEWCASHHVRSVIVLTGADHSRRIRRVLRRSMAGSTIHLMVRVSRYAGFTADEWWQYRGGLRTGIVEFEKLLLDVARHPIS